MAVQGLHVASIGRNGERVGGFLHIADQRNPPEYARVPDPQDIFGLFEVDKDGNMGGYEPCDSYRLVTREGVYVLLFFSPPSILFHSSHTSQASCLNLLILNVDINCILKLILCIEWYSHGFWRVSLSNG